MFVLFCIPTILALKQTLTPRVQHVSERNEFVESSFQKRLDAN